MIKFMNFFLSQLKSEAAAACLKDDDFMTSSSAEWANYCYIVYVPSNVGVPWAYCTWAVSLTYFHWGPRKLLYIFLPNVLFFLSAAKMILFLKYTASSIQKLRLLFQKIILQILKIWLLKGHFFFLKQLISDVMFWSWRLKANRFQRLTKNRPEDHFETEDEPEEEWFPFQRHFHPRIFAPRSVSVSGKQISFVRK